MTHKSVLPVLAEAAKNAGHLVVDLLRKGMALDVHEHKHDGSYALVADKKTEEFILQYLKKHMPCEYAVLSEESGGKPGDGLTIVVDPIDGTYNYSRNLPDFAISIGAVIDGKSVGGAVFAPHYNELYTAWQGEGAQCNGKTLHFDPQYPKQLIDVDGPSHFFTSTLLSQIQNNFSWKKGMSQVMAQMHVVRGRLDGCLLVHPYPWDVAAGIAIMQEAGVIVIDDTGGVPTMDSRFILAGNSKLTEKMLAIVQDANKH